MNINTIEQLLENYIDHKSADGITLMMIYLLVLNNYKFTDCDNIIKVWQEEKLSNNISSFLKLTNKDYVLYQLIVLSTILKDDNIETQESMVANWIMNTLDETVDYVNNVQ